MDAMPSYSETGAVQTRKTVFDPAEHPVRLAGVDRLRTALTIGVIATHAVITYAADGSWFYHEGGLPPALATLAGIPVALGALFGMGTFFFLAGLFLPASVDRHGRAALLRERTVRLGLPTVVFVLLVVPTVEGWVAAATGQYASLAAIWKRQLHQFDAGPLWFVWVLLVFTIVAVPVLGWRRSGPQPLRLRLLVGCGLFVAVASFLLRIRFGIDSYQWGAAHLWQWGQCAGLFVLGLVAGRQGWLTAIPPRIRNGCVAASILGALATIALLTTSADDLDPLGGGLHWQSLLVAAIEGVMSVSMAIVLVTLVGSGPPGRFGAVAPLAYGAYLVQTPVLVGIALAMRDAPLPTALKLGVLLPSAVLTSFTSAALLRRIPALRPVLR